MSTKNPDERYAGLTPEEREFQEHYDAEEGLAETPAEAAAPDPGSTGTEPQGEATEGGVDSGESAEDPAIQDPSAALPEDLRNRWIEMESANRNMVAELERERAEKARIRNDLAAVSGRLKPLQKRLAELERAPAPQPATTATGQDTGDIAAVFESQSWKQYAQSFPDEAGSLRDVLSGAVQITEKKLEQKLAQLDQRLASLDPIVERVYQREEESEFDRRVRALADVHPDYQQIDASPEFREWLGREYLPSLPAVIRQRMQDDDFRKEVFSDPSSVAEIITQYKQGRQPSSSQEPSQPTNRAPAVPPRVDPRLALSAAPNVRSGAVRPPNLASLDEEQLFAYGYTPPPT